MQKTYNVIADHDTLRLDRWLRKNIDNLPQGLIEKFLRNGNIKVNKRKIKSSYKFEKMIKLVYLMLVLKNKIIKIKIIHRQKKY